MAYTALGKQAMLFFNLNLFRFFASHSFASQRHASLCTKTPSRSVFLLILFPPLSQNTARMGEYGDGLDTTFHRALHPAGLFFFSFVAEIFLVPFFFIRFRIHMYNRYPESERVLVRFIKSLAGKTAKGYERERLSETQESEKGRELLFGIRYLGIMVFVILLG